MERLTPLGLKNEEIKDEAKLVLLASLVGIVGGLGAIVFRLFVDWMKEGFNLLAEYSQLDNSLAIVLVPTIGGLL